MIFRRCCFFFPLRNGCLIIGIVFTCFFFAEMTIHGKSCVFIYSKPKSWHFVQSIILTLGIIVSILMAYGSYTGKRSLLLCWAVAYLIIFILYFVMFILDLAVYNYTIYGLVFQVVVLVIIIFSTIIVHAHYQELSGTGKFAEKF